MKRRDIYGMIEYYQDKINEEDEKIRKHEMKRKSLEEQLQVAKNKAKIREEISQLKAEMVVKIAELKSEQGKEVVSHKS